MRGPLSRGDGRRCPRAVGRLAQGTRRGTGADSPLGTTRTRSSLASARPIEALDRSLLALLRERQLLGQQAARAKIAAAVPLRDPVREAVVLRRARETATELGLDAHQSERLYRLIIEMSVSQQQSHLLELETVPLRVAFLGVEGSPGSVAAQARYRSADRRGRLLEGHTAHGRRGRGRALGAGRRGAPPAGGHLEGSTRTMDLVSEARVWSSAASRFTATVSTYTRYVELAREAPAVPEDVSCKTSVILTLADRTGALDEVLPGLLASRGEPHSHRVAAGAGQTRPGSASSSTWRATPPATRVVARALREPSACRGPGASGRIRRTGRRDEGRLRRGARAFGEEAARLLPDAEPLACPSFAAVFEAVETRRGRTRRGARSTTRARAWSRRW
jgi:chorismate mutase